MGKFLIKCAVAVALTGGIFTAASAQQGPIKIGAITPNTGAMAVLGDDLARNYELAAEQINAKGGILGRKIQIIRGDASSAQEAIAAVEKLIGSDKVDVVMGTIASYLSIAASEAAMSHNKLYWETNAVARGLTERGLPNFARTGATSDNYAQTSLQATVDVLAKRLGKNVKDLKIWVEHEDSNYGTAIAQEQKKLFEAAGAKITISGHSTKAIDLTDAVLRAKKENPDIWISASYVADTNLLLRTSREQGFKPRVTMLLGVGDTPETLNAVGKEGLEGMLVVTHPRVGMNPKFGPGIEEYAKSFEAKYKTPPAIPSGLTGYVGLQILAKAIEAAKGSTESKDVLAAAKKLDLPVSSFATGYGMKFDNNMQNIRALTVMSQWQDGNVVVLYPTAAAREGSKMLELARK